MKLVRVDELYWEFVEKGWKSKRYKVGENWELNAEEIKEVIDSLKTVGEDSIVADGRQESYWEVEHHGGFSPGGNPLYRCHNCRWIFGTHMIYPNFRFCPECGYKMIDNRGVNMNHDYAHCMDYRDDCPMECFRARLTRDLNNRTDLPWKPHSWMHFEGTDECKRREKQSDRSNN